MSIPKHYSPVMPYLVLKDAEGFIDFITNVFDGKEVLRVNDDNGELRHAEYDVNGGTIMFGQSGGEWHPFPCGMFVLVKDVDGTYEKGLANGAVSNQSRAIRATAARPGS